MSLKVLRSACWALLAFFVAPLGVVEGANVACQEVRYKYSAQGMNVYDVPLTPQLGASLQICPQGPTCCTPDMEARLGLWSSRQYKDAVNNKTNQMATPFSTKATKIHEFMEKLLDESQRQFHDIFKRTYGVLYEKNSLVFREYFSELRNFFYNGRVDLEASTDKFFATLYQKMFQVMNSQYSFDSSYLMCVSENMDKIGPFGDEPRKMGSSVKRSMVAARALLKAVKSAFQIATEMKSLDSSKECLKAIQKMNSCPACQGYPNLKPCSNYCINVMKGCLVFHIELQQHWDNFIDAMNELGERLKGPFNLDNIVLSLDIKISDAIMTFQETGLRVSQKVFEICGIPRHHTSSKRSAPVGRGDDIDFGDSAPEDEEKAPIFDFSPNNQKNLVKSNSRKSEFEKVISDIRKISQDSLGFWKHLPYVMCDQPNPAFQERLFGKSEVPLLTNSNEQCWNGQDSGRYQAEIVQDGLAHLLKNPELEIKTPLVEPLLFKDQTTKLISITNQLKLAHKGQNVEWWDEDPHVEEYEGSGSGDYYPYDDTSDDEDYHDQYSGHDEEEESSGDEDYTWPTHHEETPWSKWSPPKSTQSPTIPTTTSTTTRTTTRTTTTTTSTTTSSTTSRTRIIVESGSAPIHVSWSILFLVLSVSVSLL